MITELKERQQAAFVETDEINRLSKVSRGLQAAAEQQRGELAQLRVENKMLRQTLKVVRGSAMRAMIYADTSSDQLKALIAYVDGALGEKK